MKSGFKTTEFWVTLISQLFGILATTGVLTPDQAGAMGEAAVQLAGLIAMVASAFGYAISRGNAKRGDGSIPVARSQVKPPNGFMRIRLMAGILVIAIVISCASVPTPNPVCEREGSETSWICEVTAKYNMKAEDIYYGFVDAAAVNNLAFAMTEKGIDPEAIKSYVKQIEKYLMDRPHCSYANLIAVMSGLTTEYGDAATMLAGIVNRRLGYFESSLIISQFDRQLILEGFDLFLKDLGLRGG